MILTFDVPLVFIWKGLWDIERVWFRVTQKKIEKLVSSGTAELNRFLSNGKTRIIGLISPHQELPFFFYFSK